MFLRLFSKNRNQRSKASHIAEELYSRAMLNTREGIFYERGGVPDTFDGRFDLLLVHIFIIIHVLMAGTNHKNRAVINALSDRLFDDMEQTLREMGVGDVGVSRQIKRMKDAFSGRMHAYQEAMTSEHPEASLEACLLRNLYGTVQEFVDQKHIWLMRAFVQENIEEVKASRMEKILKGHIVFDIHILNREKGQVASSNKNRKSI